MIRKRGGRGAQGACGDKRKFDGKGPRFSNEGVALKKTNHSPARRRKMFPTGK